MIVFGIPEASLRKQLRLRSIEKSLLLESDVPKIERG